MLIFKEEEENIKINARSMKKLAIWQGTIVFIDRACFLHFEHDCIKASNLQTNTSFNEVHIIELKKELEKSTAKYLELENRAKIYCENLETQISQLKFDNSTQVELVVTEQQVSSSNINYKTNILKLIFEAAICCKQS